MQKAAVGCCGSERGMLSAGWGGGGPGGAAEQRGRGREENTRMLAPEPEGRYWVLRGVRRIRRAAGGARGEPGRGDCVMRRGRCGGPRASSLPATQRIREPLGAGGGAGTKFPKTRVAWGPGRPVPPALWSRLDAKYHPPARHPPPGPGATYRFRWDRGWRSVLQLGSWLLRTGRSAHPSFSPPPAPGAGRAQAPWAPPPSAGGGGGALGEGGGASEGEMRRGEKLGRDARTRGRAAPAHCALCRPAASPGRAPSFCDTRFPPPPTDPV